jgi:uncharacterized protein YndB with AHSA1/START domain
MVTSKIIITVPAATIWQALTDKNKMKEWYFDIPDFDLTPGTVFNFYEAGGKNEFHHRCKVLEVVPNQKLSHTWTHPSHSKGESTVTWTLTETGNGTEVILTHTGLENFADGGAAFAPENYQMGWDGLLFMLKNYVNGIKKRTFSIEIDAPIKKVWDNLLNDQTYRLWTTPFCEGSYYTGELKQGGKIHFLSPDGGGMYSTVIFYNPPKNVLFQHIGELKNFEEQPLDEKTEKWTGAFENYKMKEDAGKTIVEAEVDLAPEYLDYFEEAFPKALGILKKISEK